MRHLDGLRRNIQLVDKVVQKMWDDDGTVERYWFIWSNDYELGIVPAPPVPDKDMEAEILTALFKQVKVIAYVMVSEAWTVTSKGSEEEARQVDPSQHPDREEVVMFSAENQYGQLFAKRRIVRPEKRKAILEPLEIDDALSIYEGRMSGLLPPTTRMQ